MTSNKTSILFLIGLSANINAQYVDKKVQRPNIILIMADDVTPRHLGCYGGKIPTPTIDKLAEQGMVFNRAYCTSAACTPSRYSILTGLYANRCKHEEFTKSIKPGEPYNLEWNVPLVENDVTIHEVLKNQGYYTGFVGKFHSGESEYDSSGSNLIPDLSPDDDPLDSVTNLKLKELQKVLTGQVKILTGANYAASVLWRNFDEFIVRKHGTTANFVGNLEIKPV